MAVLAASGGVVYLCVRLLDAGDSDEERLAAARAVLSGYADVVEAPDPTHALAKVGPGAASVRDAAARTRRTLAELAISGVRGCSGGVGPNRVLAALAADLADTGSVLALTRADVPAVLWPLPVERLPGIGRSMAAMLRQAGMATVGEVALAGPGTLRGWFGARGHALWAAAHGRDPGIAAHLPLAGVAADDVRGA